MKGIIYKYTSPSGKVYIGQTLNEEQRRKDFLGKAYRYAGMGINNARMKYGPENFEYEVLYEKEFETKEEALQTLNPLEEEYIKEYNSIQTGYNISKGGDSVNGIMDNEETKQRMIEGLKEYYRTHPNPFQGCKHTDETKAILREKALGRPSAFKGQKHTLKTKEYFRKCAELDHGKKVAQINPTTLEVIAIHDTIRKAARSMNCENRRLYISQICNHKKETNIAYGYKWKFWEEIERSTTIEKDGKMYYRPE
jgi:group I intron endonuclease